jgi:hypothetical protein
VQTYELGKVKFVPALKRHAMETYEGAEVKLPPCIFNLEIIWK